MKGTIGNPKYKVGDEVEFELELQGIPFRLKGEIFIVDAYGTVEQSDEPSYDIMIERLPLRNDGETLVKHIRESSIGGQEDLTAAREVIANLQAVQLKREKAWNKVWQFFNKVSLTEILTYKYEDYDGSLRARTIVKGDEWEVRDYMSDIMMDNGVSSAEVFNLALEDAKRLAWKTVIAVEG